MGLGGWAGFGRSRIPQLVNLWSMATEFHAFAACMLEREGQLKNVRAVVRMEGFGILQHYLTTITPAELIAAAGEGAARGVGAAMRAGDVSTAVKQILTYLSMSGKAIPTTPAERALQDLRGGRPMAKYLRGVLLGIFPKRR